jgi:hypothetical protein
MELQIQHATSIPIAAEPESQSKAFQYHDATLQTKEAMLGNSYLHINYIAQQMASPNR